MATSKFKQDMPPAGGYSPLDWARKVPKKINGKCIMKGNRLLLPSTCVGNLHTRCYFP